MTIQELFVHTNLELKKVFDQIKDTQWGLEMPAGTAYRPTKLGDSVRYHTYDDAWVPDVLAGKTKAEVGETYEQILTLPENEILLAYASYNEAANDAIANFNDLTKTVHLSYGDYSAREYIQHITSFRAFRIYDIAKLIGADTHMNEALVRALWEEFSPVIDSYRDMGVFPPAIKVSEDADLQTKLLALVGRR